MALRQLVHSKFRVLFTIDEQGRHVHVLHIRHGARRGLFEVDDSSALE